MPYFLVAPPICTYMISFNNTNIKKFIQMFTSNTKLFELPHLGSVSPLSSFLLGSFSFFIPLFSSSSSLLFLLYFWSLMRKEIWTSSFLSIIQWCELQTTVSISINIENILPLTSVAILTQKKMLIPILF